MSKKAPTKAQVISAIADKASLTKKQVGEVMNALEEVMAASLRRHKQFAIPGLIKITVAHKKATKARPGRNPFTGEQMMFKAKPARDVVKVRALKRLKDMV